MTTQKSMTDTLEPGRKYDVDATCKRLAGWAKEGSTLPPDVRGYSVYDYFDRDGRYLGEDTEGVEPTFAPEAE